MSQELFNNIVMSLKSLRKEIGTIPELETREKDINEIIESINSPLLIMVMGEFSTGKSTFINALVGQSITKVGAKPTTAVITKLSYGAKDRITVYFRDGSSKDYDADSFVKLTAESDDETYQFHDGIDYVARELPLDILKSMSIIDSPGLNSIKKVHEETTRRFMDKADTVLWLFDANKPGSQTEIDALKSLNPRLAPICIVNKLDTVDEDDGDSPEKIMDDIGRKLSNNKLDYQKIIGISAKMAFQGKQKNSEELIAESNINEFYDTMDTMVLPNCEQYKRNSMLDEMAKIIFSVGNKLNEKREENNRRKNTDYTSYIENETALAASFDELENIADIVMDAVELAQTSRRKKFNPSEKTFYGVLHWLALFVDKNDELAQQYLEDAAVRNDAVAQRIFAEICGRMGQNDKASYWYDRLGIKKTIAKKTTKTIKHKQDKSSNKGIISQSSLGISGYGLGSVQISLEEMLKKGKAYENIQEYENAIKWYRKAAENGKDIEMKAVADAIQQAYQKFEDEKYGPDYEITDAMIADSKKNDKEVMRLYRRAANAGDVEAMREVGIEYRYGSRVKQNYKTAMSWFRKANKVGDFVSAYWIGYMYDLGEGVSRDYTKAMEWYRKAADNGYPEAMHAIGLCYEFGKGDIKINLQEALNWYRRAVEAGDTFDERANKAVKRLEEMQKMELCRGDVDDGDAAAMREIGVDERRKRSHSTSPSSGGFAENSISSGNIMGKPSDIFYEGWCYEQGYRGYPKDYKKAMEYYQKAADMGNRDAMYHIGKLYAEGKGLPQNIYQAKQWYSKAADKGSGAAQMALKQLLIYRN